MVYFPISAFGWTDAFDGAVGFEIGEMFFYSLGGDANFLSESCGTQSAIFCKKKDYFLPTFYEFS